MKIRGCIPKSLRALSRLCVPAICLFGLMIGACEPPTAPTLSNPYDPEYAGIPVPSPPSELSLSDSGPDEITISWLDKSSFEDGYVVERSSSLDTNFVEIARLEPDATTFTDYGVEVTRGYLYRVHSTHQGKQSASSNILAVRHAGRSMVELTDEGSCSLISTLQFSPDGQHLVAGGNSAFLLRTDPLQKVGSLGAFVWDPFRIAYSDDGEYVATGDLGRVEIWSTDGMLVRRLEYSTEELRAQLFDFSPDGAVLVFAWGDDEIRVWDWKADRIHAVPNPEYPMPMRALAFAPSGDAVTLLVSNRLLTFNTTDGELLSQSPLAQWPIAEYSEVDFNRDGSLVAATVEGQIVVWETASGSVRTEIPTSRQTGVAFSGDMIIASGGSVVTVYEAAAGSLWREYSFDEIGERPQVATVSPDRRYMAAVVEDHRNCEEAKARVFLWDLNVGWETAPVISVDAPSSPEPLL